MVPDEQPHGKVCNETHCNTRLKFRRFWVRESPVIQKTCFPKGAAVYRSTPHRVIHTLNSSIAIWVVGTGGNLPNPKEPVDRLRTLLASLEAVVREYAARASPEGNVPIDKNVSRALGCKFGGSDCVHVGSAAETILEEQDVGVTSRRDRQGA